MRIDNKALQSQNIQFGDTLLNYNWGYQCLDQIADSISLLNADKYFVVTDEEVDRLYGSELEKKLSSHKPTYFLKAAPGEQYKSVDVLTTYLAECFSCGVSRKSVVIGFGGGIPGNVAGLMASLIFRGIKFIHIPTTSVAMFDSVLSLKQAVNSKNSKNSIGAFYVPKGIYADLSLLSTLPENHRRSGLCEAIKNTLCITPKEVGHLKSTLKGAMEGDPDSLEYILKSSIHAKQLVMKEDKFEKSGAVVLEYGHTIGHAIEILLAQSQSCQITHGEAVGLGMLVAGHISQELGFLDSSALDTHYDLLAMISSPMCVPGNIEIDAIVETLRFDNKRGYIDALPNETPMVLLKALGTPIYSSSHYPLYPVPNELIENKLALILQPSRKTA